jgi:hypothetical protein
MRGTLYVSVFFSKKYSASRQGSQLRAYVAEFTRGSCHVMLYQIKLLIKHDFGRVSVKIADMTGEH